MTALRVLGLAEESSWGFDRMWAAMLRTGRDVPEVTAGTTFFRIVIAAGKPDVAFVRGLHHLAQEISADIVYSVATLVVLHSLHRKPLMTLSEVVERTQVSIHEAQELMDLLEACDLVRSVGGRQFEQWVLGRRTREAFDDISEIAEFHQPVELWIQNKLVAGATLTARGISEATGLSRREVTAILMRLRADGVAMISPDGPQRGPNTGWVAVTKGN